MLDHRLVGTFLVRTVPAQPPSSTPAPDRLEIPQPGGGGVVPDPNPTPPVEPTPKPKPEPGPCNHLCPQADAEFQDQVNIGCATCGENEGYCLLNRDPETGYWHAHPDCNVRICWECETSDREDPRCCLFWVYTCLSRPLGPFENQPSFNNREGCEPDPSPAPSPTPPPSPSPTPTPCPEGTIRRGDDCACVMPQNQPAAGSQNCEVESTVNPIPGCFIIARWICYITSGMGTRCKRFVLSWNSVLGTWEQEEFSCD